MREYKEVKLESAVNCSTSSGLDSIKLPGHKKNAENYKDLSIVRYLSNVPSPGYYLDPGQHHFHDLSNPAAFAEVLSKLPQSARGGKALVEGLYIRIKERLSQIPDDDLEGYAKILETRGFAPHALRIRAELKERAAFRERLLELSERCEWAPTLYSLHGRSRAEILREVAGERKTYEQSLRRYVEHFRAAKTSHTAVADYFFRRDPKEGEPGIRYPNGRRSAPFVMTGALEMLLTKQDKLELLDNVAREMNFTMEEVQETLKQRCRRFNSLDSFVESLSSRYREFEYVYLSVQHVPISDIQEVYQRFLSTFADIYGEGTAAKLEDLGHVTLRLSSGNEQHLTDGEITISLQLSNTPEFYYTSFLMKPMIDSLRPLDKQGEIEWHIYNPARLFTEETGISLWSESGQVVNGKSLRGYLLNFSKKAAKSENDTEAEDVEDSPDMRSTAIHAINIIAEELGLEGRAWDMSHLQITNCSIYLETELVHSERFRKELRAAIRDNGSPAGRLAIFPLQALKSF